MINTGQRTFSSATRDFIEILNGPWHERALYLYVAIVIAHWLEHLAQAYQVFIMGWSRPDSGGALGLFFPWLVQSEALHFGYAVFMLVGLILFRPGFLGRSRFWWNVSLAIQGWHFFEHFLLQLQAILNTNFFGAAVQTSILQLWIPRVELHLLYNAAVFIPMVIAMYYHLYPPAGEPHAACSCSRQCELPLQPKG
jgi:hypothetical protein